MYEFKFSDIGEGLHEGKILELRLQPGDAVEQGDILAVVETDKVVAEITSSVTGVLRRYGSHVGEVIKVGDTLAYIEVAEGEDDFEQARTDVDTGEDGEIKQLIPGDGATVVGRLEANDDLLSPSDEISMPDAPEPSGDGVHQISARSLERSDGPPLATPADRRLARDLNVNLKDVRGSGEDGRIQRADICAAAEAQEPRSEVSPLVVDRETCGPPVIDDPLINPVDLPVGQRVELTTLRKTIARNMEISRKIPTAIIHDLGEVDGLVSLRTKANRNRDIHISYQSFFMKALAIALHEIPVLNAAYDEVSQDVTAYSEVNIGFAVNTEAGVLLPVIRNVDESTILAIDQRMKELVAAARNRSLVSSDLQGGTISLTNFGTFGGLWAQPMIFPPQVAILGIGRIHQTPRVVEGGAIQARVVLPVSLAFDHRVVDGVPGATLVSRFLDLLCSPQELMVSM